MAFKTQNMNQFAQAPMLGALDLIPTPDVIAGQILPTSSATAIQQGSALKLVVNGSSGAVLVDVQTGPTDAPIFGLIPYNERQNLYSPGDFTEIARSGYMYVLSGGVIGRSQTVAIAAATGSADPVATADATSGHYVAGIAIDEATASGQLIRISIQPSRIP